VIAVVIVAVGTFVSHRLLERRAADAPVKAGAM
jgi:hypothetical protein